LGSVGDDCIAIVNEVNTGKPILLLTPPTVDELLPLNTVDFN